VSDVDSPFLLSSLNWDVLCRTVRRFRPLSLPICRSNYALHDPFGFFVTTIMHCVTSYCFIALMQLIMINLCIFYQKQFLLFALRGLSWVTGSRLPSYHASLRLLDLPTLNHRSKCHGVMFLHKLINGDVDSPFFLRSLNWNVPCRTVRRFRPLSLPICRSNYALHDPFRVLCDDYNALCHVLLFDSPNATNYDKPMYFLSSNNL